MQLNIITVNIFIGYEPIHYSCVITCSILISLNKTKIIIIMVIFVVIDLLLFICRRRLSSMLIGICSGFAFLSSPSQLPHEVCHRFLVNSILFYSFLFFSILFYSILFYSILFYSILFYSILFYSIPFYSILNIYAYSLYFGSQTLNIPDAYADPRFDPSVSKTFYLLVLDPYFYYKEIW